LKPDAQGYTESIALFLKQHCVSCHTGEKPEGNLDVTKHLTNDFFDLKAKERWKEFVNVLNSHSMPPKGEKQPEAAEVAKAVDWVIAQMSRAELLRRENQTVLRRLNRAEYRNTIRDLIDVELDVSGLPADPAAGGFDNNGSALTISPLQLELYLDYARKALDRALVERRQPPVAKFHFEPEVGHDDSSRVRYGKQNPIVHGADNPVEKGMVVIHHDSWNKHPNARDFSVDDEGEYVIRVRAAGRIPTREQVVASATKILAARRDEQDAKNPKGAKYTQIEYEKGLAHFQTDRIYDYGPPRLKLVQQMGALPKIVAEFDVDAPESEPKVYEFKTRMTTEKAGITLEYDYDIPPVLENFWLQGRNEFARPTALVDWFEIEGPIYASWPPPSHLKILFPSPLQKQDETAYARAVLNQFMCRAYRRTVTNEELNAKLKLFQQGREQKLDFIPAIKLPLTAVLASPNFLYLVEPRAPKSPASATEKQARRPLSDFELATRLSYFLWSSLPDDELFQLALAGKLCQADNLRTQVNRMLKDPRAAAFEQNFAEQWLGLRELGANPPAHDLFPQYDRHLEVSFAFEGRAFFSEVLRNDLGVLNFIKSDFVVINERLARFYGIPDVHGDHFRRVPIPPGVHRGGIVTLGAIHTITSNGTRTSPVKRGVWVLKNVLGTDPGLPVANAGDIAPKVPGLDMATVRQRLEIHRTLAQCARCHNQIDPLGFALENYDAAGMWRDQEGFGYKGRVGQNDPLIDNKSKLPDGTAIAGVDGLQNALLQKEELFLKCLAGKLFTYALGRELGLADQPFVDTVVAESPRQNYSLRGLITGIVSSELFLTK